MLSNILTDYLYSYTSSRDSCKKKGLGIFEISEHTYAAASFLSTWLIDFSTSRFTSASVHLHAPIYQFLPGRAYQYSDPWSGEPLLVAPRLGTLLMYVRETLPQEAGFVTSRQVFSTLRHAAAICPAYIHIQGVSWPARDPIFPGTAFNLTHPLITISLNYV